MTSVKKNGSHPCSICGQSFHNHDIVLGALVRDHIAQLIVKEHPEWTPQNYICRNDLARYRARYIQSLLESEKGEITTLEKDVVKSIEQHEILSTNVNADFEEDRSFGAKLSDRIASFGGSWTFIIIFGTFITVWICMNAVVLYFRTKVDPYPFILLNLLLSCVAALQAPIIMMSQNRQEAKDRIHSEHDYQINLKAELEIRYLHEKLDHLLSHQWERLVEIQQVQLDLLAELGKKN